MLPASNHLSQLDFKFLSVSDFQPLLCAPGADADLDAVYRGGRSSSNKAASQDKDVCLLFNNTSPETYASPVAIKSPAAGRSYSLNMEGLELEAKYCISTQPSALDEGCEPDRVLPSMAPPKRFYRTFWRSVSFRLLHQWALSARPSCKQYLR
jgi:hypothetical protein